jgi:hypothetical protein
MSIRHMIGILVAGIIVSGDIGHGQSVVHAGSDKSGTYQAESVVVGGDDRQMLVLQRLRWARNKGFERVVFEFSQKDGKKLRPVDRAGFFHIQRLGDPKAIMLSFKGIKHMNVSERRMRKSFRKSKKVSGITFFPLVDDEELNVAINLRRNSRFEVFELQNPARVVVDIK